MKAYKSFHQERDPAFDPTLLVEDTPSHICAYIYKKCDFEDKKNDDGKTVGCEGKSVSFQFHL